MARVCPKCESKVPTFVWVDGKKHNCQRRKYCLECSPFGEHNTKRLESELTRKTKNCPDCGKLHDQKGHRCFACYFKYKQKIRVKKVQSIVGTSCWSCGYDKTWKNLCFHHVDSNGKLFGLSTRELMLSWEKILPEMKKCILVCCNCHGEIHAGIISNAEVQRMWIKWDTIVDQEGMEYS